MKTLKYAARFLMRAHSYTIINLLGLAFSLACSIVLLRYIHRELSVDTHCIDRERIIVPIRDIHGNSSVGSTHLCDTTYIPEDRIFRRSHLSLYKDMAVECNDAKHNSQGIFTDSCFLQMFRFQALEGTLGLDAPDRVLLSEAYAKRLFGTGSAIGRTLRYQNKIYTVRGVVKEPSCKTLLKFDLLLPREDEFGSTELIQVLPGFDLEAVNKVSNVFRKVKFSPTAKVELTVRWRFVSLKDLYFDRPSNIRAAGDFFNFGSTDYLYILFIVAVLLLFVGVLNFVNLYMVLMMKRSKEYGIKKVFGLQKWALFLQIWAENVLLAIGALLVAWLIVEVTQVPVNNLMGVKMNYTLFDLHLSLGFLLVVPLITSVYPYIRYQYMSPITSIRSIATGRQSVVARMLLLAVQYIVTFTLVVFSLYLNKHFNFLIHTPPGFDCENVMEAELLPVGHINRSDMDGSFDRIGVLYDKLDACPDIEIWFCGGNILEAFRTQMAFFNDKDESVEMNAVVAGSKFFKLYRLQMVEGELSDSTSGLHTVIVLNQAAMKALGYNHLEEAFIRTESALETKILEDGNIEQFGLSLFPVKAVVKDYYPGHLAEGIKPLAFRLSLGGKGISTGKFQIRIREGREQAVIAYLKNAVQEVYGTDEISYTWMKDQVKAVYDEDRKVATIYTVFALIAIAVSCLGLFGISLFDIRQRYREIAIRKVNGAGMKDLYKLLFRKYAVVLCISFCIAIPLAYYAIHTYTQDFVMKAPMGIGIFLIALLIVAVISFGTLYWQVNKAARIDPAKTMKME